MNICNTVFPTDVVCLRHISLNTLHKGDDDDDDDDDDGNNNPYQRIFIIILSLTHIVTVQ